MIVRQGMTMALAGTAAGLAAAFALTRFMDSLLFGVRATDPLTFIGVSTLLIPSVSRRDLFSQPPRGAHHPITSLREE